MIDFTALSALATSALMMHHPDRGADVPDCRFPADVARDLVGIQLHGNGMDDSSCFGLGFEFALRLGALLAIDPLNRNLTKLIVEYKKLVAETYVDRAPDYGEKLAAAQ